VARRAGRTRSPENPATAKSRPRRNTAKARTRESDIRLNYVRDDCVGITRRKLRGHFAYFLPDGSRLKDPVEIKRINALAIPPAYTNVWICIDPAGHLQATGRDARGRKQYRYHPSWREMRDANKYDRMLAFSHALPLIRRRVEEDLARPGVPRERVLATLVRLLETTLIRVGNEAYAQANDSYGLTTLQNEHVAIQGSQLNFSFRGKSGVEHDISVRDARLAKIVRRCADIPGDELFQYLDEDGQRHKLGSGDVNDYLRDACTSAGVDASFTAKDFRTWAGSTLALDLLAQLPPSEDEATRKKNVVSIVESVAERLGNTPAVCRRCYIHPEILRACMEGSAPELSKGKAGSGLNPDEARLQQFLESLPLGTRT
jgi:DNA topoisomerase I